MLAKDKHRAAPLATAALKCLGLCSLSLIVAGCVETAAQRQPDPQAMPRVNMARRDGVSPRGASVAVADIQGVPAAVSADLANAFEKQARARDINLADAKTANYLVRGYVTPSPAEGGAAFEVVWDVYDSKKRRMQRVDDFIFVKDSPAMPDQIDPAAVNQIAAKSADDLAAVLTNMPEAIAAAGAVGNTATSVAQTTNGITRVPAAPAVASTAPQVQGIGMAAATR
jgi:hypothetical protein